MEMMAVVVFTTVLSNESSMVVRFLLLGLVNNGMSMKIKIIVKF